MEIITIYMHGTIERKRLGDVANVLEHWTGGKFEVDDVYFDYGQNWKWTTIVNRDVNYQILSPRQLEDIIRGHEDRCLDELVDTYFHLKKQSLENSLNLLNWKKEHWEAHKDMKEV